MASKWIAALSFGILALSITYAGGMQYFMPGPITTVHSSIGKCTDCHSNISEGQFGWVHSVVAAASPLKDSNNCLTCHKMSTAALNPHGLKLGELDESIKRLEKYASSKPMPTSARIRNTVFPFKSALADGVFCATCHKEHQGKKFDLKEMSQARCHTCHTVQFDSFHAGHPKFDNYPFKRRTRIAFDHASHFDKRFPETRSKNAVAKELIPNECADCHTSKADRRLMSVKPFEETCSACHRKQIIGAERATGPKGIVLLTLPGIDVETLKEKEANIGEWPEQSEGEITPVMKLLIGWDNERKQLLDAISKLDLLDLTEASDDDITRVETFVWEVKKLFHALTTAKTSDVLKRIGSATGVQLAPSVMAKLTANMPRDVLMAAQQEWLPNLYSEIEQHKDGAIPIPAAQDKKENDKQQQASVAPEAKAKPASPEIKDAQAKSPDSEKWHFDAFGRLIKGGRLPEDEEPDQPDDTPSASEPGPFEAGKTANHPAALAVNAENWAEFGGLYRQDYSILYKPTGHADNLLHAWLDFSGKLASKEATNLAFPVFELLTSKDAQGQCTKCHSIDAGENGSRVVNWSPLTRAKRSSRFTKFSHEPHYGLFPKNGCLACHGTNNAKGFQDAFMSFNPKTFVSNFKPVEQKMCATCHNNNMARDDCLLCHKYHVNEVTSPITATRIPSK